MKAITLKCPSCGSDLMVDTSGREYVFCNYCGKQVLLDNGKRTISINHNIRIENRIHKRITDDAEVIKAKNEGRQSKLFFIVIVLLLIAAAMMIYYPQLNKSNAIKQGKIQAGFYRDYINENYEVMKKQLEAAGFKNIEIIDLNEPGLLGGKKDKIKNISIGGDGSFDSGDWFDPNDKVIISHY